MLIINEIDVSLNYLSSTSNLNNYIFFISLLKILKISKNLENENTMRKQNFISHQNRFIFSRQITNLKILRNSINQNARILKKMKTSNSRLLKRCMIFLQTYRFATKSTISHFEMHSNTFFIFVVIASKRLNQKINFINIFVIAKKMSNVTFLLEILLSFEENFKSFFRRCINILY